MTAASTYREWAPPPGLAHAVACLWSHTVGHAPPAPVLPDGCTDVIWRQGEGAFVAGPDTGPAREALEPGAVLVGLRFRPGAGRAGLGVPLEEIRDRRVDLADLLPRADRRLPPDLRPADAASALALVAGGQLEDRAPDPAVAEAVTVLADPAVRLDEVSRCTGLSERQLRRRFRAAVGYGPKTLQRVLRFRAFLDRAEADADLAMAAALSGYADQPHLNRECRQLAGTSPSALIAARSRSGA